MAARARPQLRARPVSCQSQAFRGAINIYEGVAAALYTNDPAPLRLYRGARLGDGAVEIEAEERRVERGPWSGRRS